MWSSNASRREFLTKTPDGTHYLIASHSGFADDEARRSRLRQSRPLLCVGPKAGPVGPITV